MDATSTRAKNIAMLVDQAGGPTAFGKLIDRDQVQVSQWTSLTKPKPIGGRLARYIDRRLGRDPGWLDRPQWGEAEAAAASNSQSVRLDPEIVSSTHQALKEMYALKGRVYHEEDVARFVLVYEKLAARKAGVTEAELFGAGLSESMERTGGTSERNASAPSEGADTRTVARRIRR